MVAKDWERIPMHEPFTMEGEVELYLNRLTDRHASDAAASDAQGH